jgi:hypothetical protein
LAGPGFGGALGLALGEALADVLGDDVLAGGELDVDGSVALSDGPGDAADA